MTRLNAERRPEPRRATSEAMWDKTDIWVKCHITEVVLLCDNISLCCVGRLRLPTSGPGLRLFPVGAVLPARWQCSSCGFPCSRRAWWSCSPAAAPAAAPPEWRSSRPSWPSTCASCSAPVNWRVLGLSRKREKSYIHGTNRSFSLFKLRHRADEMWRGVMRSSARCEYFGERYVAISII